jgi:hypothetical protein
MGMDRDEGVISYMLCCDLICLRGVDCCDCLCGGIVRLLGKLN